MVLPAFRHDPVRVSLYIVGGVFLLAGILGLVSIWQDRANLDLLDAVSAAGGAILMVGLSFVAQSIPAFIGCAAAWRLGRTWAGWDTADYVLAVVPWACWASLTIAVPREKTLANFWLEGLAVGLAAPIGAFVRLGLARLGSVKVSRAISYGATVAFAAGIWWLVPLLPE